MSTLLWFGAASRNNQLVGFDASVKVSFSHPRMTPFDEVEHLRAKMGRMVEYFSLRLEKLNANEPGDEVDETIQRFNALNALLDSLTPSNLNCLANDECAQASL